MSDQATRALERAAHAGDPYAQERLARTRSRAAQGPHADKVGHECFMVGVRDHYKGTIIGIVQDGAGRMVFQMHPVKWLQNLENDQGSRDMVSSEEHPFDLRSDGILAITRTSL